MGGGMRGWRERVLAGQRWHGTWRAARAARAALAAGTRSSGGRPGGVRDGGSKAITESDAASPNRLSGADDFGSRLVLRAV